jgi:hypothetical protein
VPLAHLVQLARSYTFDRPPGQAENPFSAMGWRAVRSAFVNLADGPPDDRPCRILQIEAGNTLAK